MTKTVLNGSCDSCLLVIHILYTRVECFPNVGSAIEECLERCRDFLEDELKRDFFVQIATGGGKSLVMADLLTDLADGKQACVAWIE